MALLLAGCAHGGHDHGAGHHGHHAEGHHAEGHHDFSDAERWAKVFDAPERDAWQKPKDVVRLAGIGAGQVVADLGAGTGYFLPHLAEAVGPTGKVLGLDIEASLVEHMSRRIAEAGLANVVAKTIASDDPGLAPGSVDAILIVDTWHHIPAREAYASRLASALRPGGRVVIVDFLVSSEKGPPAEMKIPPEEVVKTLTNASLSARVIESGLPDQYLVVGERAR